MSKAEFCVTVHQDDQMYKLLFNPIRSWPRICIFCLCGGGGGQEKVKSKYGMGAKP